MAFDDEQVEVSDILFTLHHSGLDISIDTEVNMIILAGADHSNCRKIPKASLTEYEQKPTPLVRVLCMRVVVSCRPTDSGFLRCQLSMERKPGWRTMSTIVDMRICGYIQHWYIKPERSTIPSTQISNIVPSFIFINGSTTS